MDFYAKKDPPGLLWRKTGGSFEMILIIPSKFRFLNGLPRGQTSLTRLNKRGNLTLKISSFLSLHQSRRLLHQIRHELQKLRAPGPIQHAVIAG